MVVLNRMREEDPTWEIEQSKELKQTIVHGQGEFHLRTLKWRLENNEKLQIKFEEPKIPYRETITKAARADYRHKKQSGGAGQFGEVHLIVEPYYEGMPVPDTYKFNGQEFKINVKGTEEVPLEWGGKLVFINSVVREIIRRVEVSFRGKRRRDMSDCRLNQHSEPFVSVGEMRRGFFATKRQKSLFSAFGPLLVPQNQI